MRIRAWRLARLYLRTRSLLTLGSAAALIALVLSQLRSALVTVPFAPETTTVDLALMTPILPVLIMSVSLPRSLGALENLRRARMRELRCLHVMVVVLAAELCAVSAMGRPLEENVAIGLNAMLLVGIALTGGVLSQGSLVWLAPLAAVALCFFFGTGTQDGRVHPWAVLLSEPSLLSLSVAATAFGVGTGLFVMRGPRAARS